MPDLNRVEHFSLHFFCETPVQVQVLLSELWTAWSGLIFFGMTRSGCWRKVVGKEVCGATR